MTPPATIASLPASLRCPKLILSGSTSQLAISSTIEARSASRPATHMVFSLARRVTPGQSRPAPSSEATIAVLICGRNSSPYWLLDRS